MRPMLIALAALSFVAPQASGAATRDCGPRAARTVRQSATIRVFVQKHTYFACWRRSARQPEELGSAVFGPGATVGGFRLRGRYLAYWYASCRTTPCRFVVELLNIERGSTVAVTESLEGRVRTLVATRGGAAGFLADDGHTRFVQKLDSLGVEEIDRGPAVRSLTVHGTRLHWFSGTNARDEHIAHVRRCGPIEKALTVALSRNLRVYAIAPHEEDAFRSYACLLGGGKPMFLGADSPPSTQATFQEDFHPSGHHVVWLEKDCYMDGCLTRPHSADLAARTKRAGDWRTGIPTVFPNRRGFAALLYPGITGVSDYQLLSFDSTGESLLDESAGIDPESIAVYRDAVVWRDNGEQRSAPLR